MNVTLNTEKKTCTVTLEKKKEIDAMEFSNVDLLNNSPDGDVQFTETPVTMVSTTILEEKGKR